MLFKIILSIIIPLNLVCTIYSENNKQLKISAICGWLSAMLLVLK